jgi:YidC/Oxa1 family membrane protein insertase
VLPLAILEPIEEPLTSLLEWLHTSIGFTWAWSIVALTVLVRIVILPLTIKSIRSMQRLQQYAPELKALQQKYKHDRQRLNEEVMKFYRENKVNPAASCLPLLLQAPVFLALFFVLRDFEDEVLPDYPAAELSWLGIVPNITDPINSHWSGALLIVIYAVSQVASIYYSMSSAATPAWQRYMFMALPVVFIPVIIRFPMGLMLYWSTTNLWTVGQGFVTRRLAPKPQAMPKKSSRTPPREESDAAGGDAATAKPAPKPGSAAPAAAGGQQRVRRRKKKGPQAGRRR